MACELIAEAITDYFGERCLDYAEGCPTCEAWAEYDRLNTRPAPAATDTGLVTVAFQHRRIDKYGVVGDWRPYKRDLFGSDRIESRELITRSQAEAIIRDLETKILEAAISDCLDDAGTPLSWQERAEIAEGIISDLKADNAAKDARIKELRDTSKQMIDNWRNRAETAEAKLAAAEKSLEPFANAADGRKSESVTGSVCFSQHYLLAARAALEGKPS